MWRILHRHADSTAGASYRFCERHVTRGTPIVVSGCVGPRGDGYVAAETMSADEAAAYNATQIGSSPTRVPTSSRRSP
jgi:hypothetical protein